MVCKENAIKMEDLGVRLFLETPIFLLPAGSNIPRYFKNKVEKQIPGGVPCRPSLAQINVLCREAQTQTGPKDIQMLHLLVR